MCRLQQQRSVEWGNMEWQRERLLICSPLCCSLALSCTRREGGVLLVRQGFVLPEVFTNRPVLELSIWVLKCSVGVWLQPLPHRVVNLPGGQRQVSNKRGVLSGWEEAGKDNTPVKYPPCTRWSATNHLRDAAGIHCSFPPLSLWHSCYFHSLRRGPPPPILCSPHAAHLFPVHTINPFYPTCDH